MEPYWKHEFEFEGIDEKHVASLYQYSERSIALISTPYFGKTFAKNFKELKGKFNGNLTINEEKSPGWIFKLDDETQESLISLLGDINSGKIKPSFTGIKVPDFSEKSRNNKIYTFLSKLVDLIPEVEEEIEYHNDDKMCITMYFNRSEDTVTQGDLIYEFTSAHKKAEIYQLAK